MQSDVFAYETQRKKQRLTAWGDRAGPVSSLPCGAPSVTAIAVPHPAWSRLLYTGSCSGPRKFSE